MLKMRVVLQFIVIAAVFKTALFSITNTNDKEILSKERSLLTTTNYEESRTIGTATKFDESTTKTANSDVITHEENQTKDVLLIAETNSPKTDFTPLPDEDLFNYANLESATTKTKETNENMEKSSATINDENASSTEILNTDRITAVTEVENELKFTESSTIVGTTLNYVIDDTTNIYTAVEDTETTTDNSESLTTINLLKDVILSKQRMSDQLVNKNKNDDQTLLAKPYATEKLPYPVEISDSDETKGENNFYSPSHYWLKLQKAGFNDKNSSDSTKLRNSITEISSTITETSFDTQTIHSSIEDDSISITKISEENTIAESTTKNSNSTSTDSTGSSSESSSIENTITTPGSTTTDNTGSSSESISTENAGSSTDNTSTDDSTSDSTTESSTSIETTTLDPCKGDLQVQNFYVKPSNFFIYLNWTNPLPESDCNFEYNIKWVLKSKKTGSYKTKQTEYTIEDLNACEDYSISVAIDENTAVTYESRTSETMENIKSISHSNFNETSKSIQIKWDLPTRVKKCLKNYVFQAFKDDMSVIEFDHDRNEITVHGINGCVNNTFLVYAQSVNNYKTEGISTSYLHPNEVNDPPIYNAEKTEISEDYVVTKWSFGKFTCRPERFHVQCKTEKEEVFLVPGEMENDELIAQIDNVEPYTNYSCCGIITNKKGESKCSEPGIFLTKSKAPQMSTGLTITPSKDNLNIKWEAPIKWNGLPENFNISIEFIKLNYDLPKGCEESGFSTLFEVLDKSETEFNFKTIVPASKYKISVKATSDGGCSEIIKEVDLEETEPEGPEMKVQVIHSDDKEYKTSVNVSWETPCKMHGVLNSYLIRIGPENTEQKHVKTPNWYIFESLKPEQEYLVQIQAINNKYSGKISEMLFKTPAGIPLEPDSGRVKKPDTYGLTEPWNSAVVYLSNDLFDEYFGEIRYYSIIVAPKNCKEESKHEYYNPEVWPTVASDDKSCTAEQSAYEATPEKWNPFKLIAETPMEDNYTLGIESNCEKKDCNKPLTPGTEYCMKIRGFTSAGYRDTALIYFKTEDFSEVQVGLIVGLIIGILAIAIVIASVLFYTKGKLNFKNWPRMQSTGPISPAPLPVPIKKFGSYYKNMIENPGKIKNEFQLLSTISSDVTLSTKTALLPINKKKNRYMNILPYDQTRVPLRDINANSTDYINASYITGYSGANEYIASQGPTESTYPAFWQMVLEQNIKLIVMLTQFVEAGKDKCYKYFPDLDDPYEINDLTVSCMEEEIMEVYNKRTFKIKKGNITKKLTHIQYNLWPDFGVPDEVRHMIDFCETMDEMKIKKPGLILIHCSAGVGRTGTLIAMDILLQALRDKRKVDIFGTVLNLRKQRMHMVQSERQYEFLYKCVYYVITNQMRYSTSKRNLNTCESVVL